MNANTLNYVLEIAEQGSFSKAAKKLYVAQPSLSQSIKALEREIGAELFDRSATPIKLTYAGELFAAWAKEAKRSGEDVQRRISAVAAGAKTRLKIGVSFSRSVYLLPQAVAKFRQQRPNCTIVLLEQAGATTAEQQEDFDLLIGVPHDESLLYTNIILDEEQMLLAVPKEFDCPAAPSKGYPIVRLQDFRDYPFIVLSDEQMLHRVCFSLCGQAGFTPNVVLECRNLQVVHAMLENGVGISFLPERFAKYAYKENGIRYCTVENNPFMRKISVSYRNDRYLSEDARVMIELLKQAIK